MSLPGRTLADTRDERARGPRGRTSARRPEPITAEEVARWEIERHAIAERFAKRPCKPLLIGESRHLLEMSGRLVAALRAAERMAGRLEALRADHVGPEPCQACADADEALAEYRRHVAPLDRAHARAASAPPPDAEGPS